jgi:predicted nucleic acid-binding protein
MKTSVFLRNLKKKPLTLRRKGLWEGNLKEMRRKRLNVNIRSTIDLLIAQIALENDLILLHNDNDFNNIANLSGLKIYKIGLKSE